MERYWIPMAAISVHVLFGQILCTTIPPKTLDEHLRHNHHRGNSLENIAGDATTSRPAIIFAMAYGDWTFTALPVLTASLAAADPARMLGQHLFVGVTNEAGLHSCQQVHNIRRCWLDDKQSVPHEPVPERQSWLPMATISMGWRKLEIVPYLLGLGIGIIAVDVDLIFLRNPFELWEDPAYSQLDLFVQNEGGDVTGDWTFGAGNINIGFYYVAPTEMSQQLLHNWLANTTRWDQGVLKEILRDKQRPDLKWRPLPTSLAYSFCHFGKLDVSSDSDWMKTCAAFLRKNDTAFAEAYVMHFPCCNYPSGDSFSKSIMMNLVLAAKLKLLHP